jgi:methyltransferase (TIGR00027 family)
VAPDQPLTGVGRTALGMAMVRAGEARRVERLFDDPFAEAFLAAAPEAFRAERQARAAGDDPRGLALGTMFYVHAVLRTRFYDDYLRTAATTGCRQVVLLAAGLDSRGYRLDWPPGTRLFELDLPEVLAFKAATLAELSALPRCERITVPVDLRDDWVSTLTRSGFDPATPTAWLAEGLLIYLSAEEAGRLFTGISDLSAPGSRLSLEHGNTSSALLTEARAAPSMIPYTTLWKGGLAQDTTAWLQRHGWSTDLHGIAEVATRYGRDVPATSTSGFLIAVRDTAAQPPH